MRQERCSMRYIVLGLATLGLLWPTHSSAVAAEQHVKVTPAVYTTTSASDSVSAVTPVRWGGRGWYGGGYGGYWGRPYYGYRSYYWGAPYGYSYSYPYSYGYGYYPYYSYYGSYPYYYSYTPGYAYGY
jgi:hypothetical protein